MVQAFTNWLLARFFTPSPLYRLTSEDISHTLECCIQIAPAYMPRAAEQKLNHFLQLAMSHDILQSTHMAVGLKYLDMFYHHFPIENFFQHNTDKCFMRCILAFMLATKGPDGADRPYNNKTFFVMYQRSGGSLEYCATLDDFNTEEFKLVVSVLNHPELNF